MFDFLKRKPFGLQISDERVRMVQFKEKTSKEKPIAMGSSVLPHGIVQDGKILDPSALSQSILELKSSTTPHKITQDECVVVLPDAQIYEHIFYFPGDLSEEKLERVIRAKIKETIPVPFDELIYQVVEYDLKEIKVVFVVAIEKAILESYQNVLEQNCGLKPIAFEPESLSLLRGLDFKCNENRGTLLIYTEEKMLKWVSFWSGWIFDSNIFLKEKESWNFDQFFTDLESSMRFFKERTQQSIEEIILAGAESVRNYLENELKERLKIPIQSISLEQIAENNEDFTVVIGAALKTLDGANKVVIDFQAIK